MKPRSSLAADIPTSGIKAMRDLTRSLEGVIHLEVGEPDFPTPPEIIESALAAARGGATRYTPTGGTEQLRRAIAARVGRRHGRSIGPDQVIATSGATATIAVTLMTLAEEGDEVLVPDPGWASYAGMVFLSGATAVAYPQPRQNGFLPDATTIGRLITPRTKALILNNPGNPGGAVFPKKLVQDLVDLAADRDVYVISDEIYEDFTYDSEHVPAAPFDNDGRVITVSGFSKTFAMTGWRLGYAVAAPDVTADITKVAGPMLSCPSSVSQAAGEAALKMDAASIAAMRDSYRRRRDLVVSILEPAGLLPVRPQGAFYAMVDVSKVGEDSNAVALDLLRQQQVATAPGEAFGPAGKGYLRVSFATAEAELAEGLRRIVRFAESSTKTAAPDADARAAIASRR